MKKVLTLSVACLASLALFTTSCKKSDDTKSRKDLLVGSWSYTQTGDDNNNNGVLDDNEKQAVTGTDTSTTVFNSNGSGYITGNLSGSNITIPLQWNLQNNDNYLRLIYSFLGTTDTSVVEIKTLDASNLVIRDTSTSPANFSVFVKK